MSMSDTVFIIDASPLFQSSRRPRHLQERLGRVPRQSCYLEAAMIKRQALMEQRKERIAQRMARVQQVSVQQKQRRESERKAAQSSLEQIMSAVQNNRDRLMQHKINAMARRVKHAKIIAKQANQRSAEEADRKRQQLDVRQSLTEIRRNVLLRMPRSKHMGRGQSEISRILYAAGRIQNWWRSLTITHSLRKIKEVDGLSVERLREMSFEVMANHVQQIKIMSLISKIIPNATEADTKVFLSAFLVVHHPSEIFSEIKDEEKAVTSAANRMMEQYGKSLEQEKLVSEFFSSWAEYKAAFNKWKARDTKVIIDSMIQHFVQLEQLWESVKDNVDADGQWRPRIERQQRLIKQKVQRLGGRSAIARLIAKVREMRDAHVDHDSLTSLPEARVEQKSNSVLDSRYNISLPVHAGPEKPVHDLHRSLSSFGAPMSNEQLAHELVMDPEFELKRATNDTLEGRVSKMAKKAFFDKIREDMSNGSTAWVPSVVTDIRQQLLELAPERNGLRKQLTESMDIDLVKQQMENGTFNINDMLGFVCEKMLAMCAPVRDSEIRDIENAEDVLDAIMRIFETLDNMKMDMANFRLRALRPHLMQQAVEYEKSKFSQALAANQVNITRTKQWLMKSANKAQETAAARNPENIQLPENPVKFDSVYADALLSLIFEQEPVSGEFLPETLYMDAERLFGFQNESQAITVVAALMMLSRNLSMEFRENREAVQNLKKNLFMFLQDQTTTIENLAQLIVSSINDAIKPLGKVLSEEQCVTIKTMVDKTLSFRDTVFTLLNRRAMAEIRVHLLSGRFRRDTNNGLDVVIDELEKLSMKIFRLAMHNRQVYSIWYDDLIREALSS